MTENKFTIVRLAVEGDKFELLVKPDPALEYKLGKRADISSVLVSDEVYSDANKGSRASSEKLMKHFKTTDSAEVARQILARGELNLTTDQRRKMVEEKRKQIVAYINRSFVDPKSHLPHPITRIEAAMEQARVSIDPHKKAEDQAKDVVDALRAILPLKSETLKLIVRVPPQYAGQSYSVIKPAGDLKSEEWQADGSLRVVIEMNAGMRGNFIDRLGSVTKGTAEVKEA
ncbi:rRNA metabolism protein, SBDS family [Candidatus Nitrososphaera evergladensis SR1]|jgi:ribosome maturation protein SDO1|uniref:rRNA metabolism protein, SBDS family n=1 Tax=Candidatus Nitrososphaera evergladensis SR1 TaxID=1459636 RepID=A0A075MRG8_9ARCH|nr:ribosome assembly factor SBDS [Candidatus Nitrososphaera evergladensis]AIF83407.1 rRNA metabolism protein, SBDS family [Candidatus Nitrososphaera evergladensis SR1]